MEILTGNSGMFQRAEFLFLCYSQLQKKVTIVNSTCFSIKHLLDIRKVTYSNRGLGRNERVAILVLLYAEKNPDSIDSEN